MVLGLACVALGTIGVVVPGLPTTVFFIAAAACFARSNERLERWLLGLPGVGRMVADHRAGLGMPRRAKLAAIASIVGFSTLAVIVIGSWWPRAVVIGAAAAGVVVIAIKVPTRERVVAQQAVSESAPTSRTDGDHRRER